jgi:hypothetical protein
MVRGDRGRKRFGEQHLADAATAYKQYSRFSQVPEATGHMSHFVHVMWL